MKAGLMVAVATMIAFTACGGKDDRPPSGQSGRPRPHTQAQRPAKLKPAVMRPAQSDQTMTAERIRERKAQVRGDIHGMMAQIDGELNR